MEEIIGVVLQLLKIAAIIFGAFVALGALLDPWINPYEKK